MAARSESTGPKDKEMDPCLHCGESVKYHGNCNADRLSRAREKFKQSDAQSEHVLSMAIHVNYLYGISKVALQKRGVSKQEAKKDKRKKREKKLKELLRKVTALRNSNSGYLIIQLVGLAAKDTFLGSFHELIDEKLNELIEDGSLFGCVFKKGCFPFDEENFLVLYVEGTNRVTTSDFKTKTALDYSIVAPSPATMKGLIETRREPTTDSFPDTIESKDLINLRENRALQLKGTKHIKDKLVDQIWEELKLREYISGFAKNERGGTYILGIEEEETQVEGAEYMSMKNSIYGIKHSDCEEIQKRILKDAKEKLIAYDHDGKVIENLAPVKVTITDKSKTHGVIQVAVRPVSGIVYYHPDGPLAYRIKETEGTSVMEKIPYKDWHRLFTGKALD